MKRLCSPVFFAIAVLLFAIPLTSSQTSAQEQPKLVDFQQHVQPILQNQCFGCHGAKEQKGGLRVDEVEGLRGYIEAGDLEKSSLWTDYLHTQDPEMLMPPASDTHKGGLPIAELLVIKTWISEGAVGEWKTVAEPIKEDTTVIPDSPLGKVWAFQGLFHPAAVHLPIALLAVSTLFVFFSFVNRESCEPVAYHCLWIGSLGAIVACVTGWSYAVYEGHGIGFSFDLEKSDIDRHRWLGVFVAGFSLLMVPLARSVRLTSDVNKRVMWGLAGLVLLAAVSVTGFQGGELTYGEGHYAKYYKKLFSDSDTSKKSNEEPVSGESTPTESQPADLNSDLPQDPSAPAPKVEATPASTETQPAEIIEGKPSTQ